MELELNILKQSKLVLNRSSDLKSKFGQLPELESNFLGVRIPENFLDQGYNKLPKSIKSDKTWSQTTQKNQKTSAWSSPVKRD